MQLGDNPPIPDLRRIEERLRDLKDELTEVRELEAKREQTRASAMNSEEERHRLEQGARDKKLREELRASRTRAEKKSARLAELGERRRARIENAAAGTHELLKLRLAEERRRTDGDVSRIRKELDAANRRACGPLEVKLKRWEELQPEIGAHRKRAEEALTWFSVRHGTPQDRVVGWAGDLDVEADPEAMADDAHGAFRDATTFVEREGGRWSTGLARTGFLIGCQVLLILLAAGGALVLLRSGSAPADLLPVLVGLLVLSGLLHLVSRLKRKKLRRVVAARHGGAIHRAQRFEQHANAARKHLDARLLDLGEDHVRNLDRAEERERDASRSRSAAERRQLEWLEKRKEGAEARLASRLLARAGATEDGEQAVRAELQATFDAETSEESARYASRLAEIEEEATASEVNLRERREAALAEFTAFAEALGKARGESWDSVDPAGFVPPVAFPRAVPLGRLAVSLPALLDEEGVPEMSFDLPVATTYPEHGSLVVEHPPGDRDRAIRLLLNAILRNLAAIPPGRIRLTILDPVGLGQSFSALMHLADHDEDLVNHRIWTETSHIEQRLADLSEHIEKVIQKYLRNRYASIGEYNEEAGDLQEPYHFLVIADFPTSFNDLAAERLASIISSGPRCGVYTLIARDLRQSLPPAVDQGLLRRNGPLIRWEEDEWRLEGELLGRGDFTPDRPPNSVLTNRLLDRIGALSVDANQVQLDFEAVVPGGESLWTGNADLGVRVSIGRTGAERLQYLDLGRGTCQHALVAGRTGSGKSTLFHVMITNMALWFSPDELQFYLVDFKKGVEFKVFANYGLPHARVVAIESDREFGLSVLRAVDAELARRGDLFRAQGVQDLTAYRRRPGVETLPRTLLLIDEFQEYFTDDDSVAHDAAVLLDRFVRQGRAFGIHVVLGSQTLSGIYTLARGTLGQMGVRIALQCNESDSNLILSEDNGVARLLSRPGEAIYNDQSGLLAGNNPFQVVWLPEDEQARQLRRIADRAAEEDDGHGRETVVFEGNQPADILENAELLAMVAAGPAGAEGDDRAWLGEPNAIKGPTEAAFPAASGSNLLIVGQRREAAFAMMASSIFSLCARRRPGDLRIVILDGGGHEPKFASHFDDLIAAVPHHVERYDVRTAADAVSELADLVEGREQDDGEGSPVYVFAFGLQRLRMLRKADDFAMPFGDDAGPSSGDRFSTILTEGPPQRVHTVIWCDTVQNLQRTLSRRTMREFDVRVLFQMSAADSSELIESSAANRLGLNSALLAVESLGTFEKFRPYAIPSADVMNRLGGAERPSPA